MNYYTKDKELLTKKEVANIESNNKRCLELAEETGDIRYLLNCTFIFGEDCFIKE